ncbi:TetR/AcrR family transcriptional regulator [Microlunatus speluncae]|uniref:TetR/AcrR family transcriptional regulator n=1 Tax=Microlunatus speluncae TaxID=2594267 RepID=UPI00126638B5|nr:TetR/AcrR family transcriptional regulator [Microlunatus speluncae]
MAESRTGVTRDRLLTGALACLLDQGIAKTSARTIAAAAGVNQALIFYHFGSVDALLAAACRRAAEQRVARYRERLAGVTSLAGLLDVGREIHAAEHADGNVAVLAQLLAGAQANPQLGPATAAGLHLWIAEIEVVLERVVTGTPLAGLVDPPGLARAVAASFIGLELYDGVDPAGSTRAFTALDQLAALAALIDDRNPVVRRAVSAALRHGVKKSAGSRREGGAEETSKRRRPSPGGDPAKRAASTGPSDVDP